MKKSISFAIQLKRTLKAERILVALLILFHSPLSLGFEEIKHFKKLNLEQGLSQSTVKDIVIDDLGHVWIATHDGINKYNGYEIEQLKSGENYPDLNSNIFESLATSVDGFIWAVTSENLIYRYNLRTEKFKEIKIEGANLTDDKEYRVNHKIFISPSNKVFLVSQSGNVFELNQTLTRFIPTSFPPPDSLHSNKKIKNVHGIYFENQNTLLITSDGKLLNISNQKVNQIADIDVTVAASKMSGGTVWIATPEQELISIELDNQKVHRFSFHNSSSDSTVIPSSLAIDLSNNVWMGTKANGVFYFDGTKFTNYRAESTEPNTLSSNVIYSIHSDKKGNLWLGTDKGVSFTNVVNDDFKHWKYRDSNGGTVPEDNMVWAISEHDGIFLLGTQNGLKAFDKNGNSISATELMSSVQTEEVFQALNSTVYSIEKISSNNFILSTAKGAYFIALKSDEHISIVRMLSSSRSRKSRTINNHIFLATAKNGLEIFKIKEIDRFQVQHLKTISRINSALLSDSIYALTDDKNHLWIGTEEGLNRLSLDAYEIDEDFKTPDDASDPGSAIVFSLFSDSSGLWFGTSKGLNYLKNGSSLITTYGTPQGLVSNQIYSMIKDNQNRLWLGTPNGLSTINLKTLEIKSVPKSRPLQSSEFNRNAVLLVNDIVLMGGINGLTLFKPEQVRLSSLPPAPIITEILLSNVPVSQNRQEENPVYSMTPQYSEKFSFNYKDKMITFSFAGIEYYSPHDVKYQYQLEGYDDSWISTDSRRRYATYTSLPSGEYRFRIRAKLPESDWTASPNQLKVIKHPPWWATFWAYAFYLALITIAVKKYLYAQKSKLEFEKKINKQLKLSDKIKDEFLAKTSHELRTPLNGIIGLSESLHDGVAGELPNQAKKNLSLIARSGRRLSNLVNDILDYAQLQHNEIRLNKKTIQLSPVIDVVISICAPLASEKNISLNNKTASNLPPVLADEERLEQILVNLIGNAIKHTDHGEITIGAFLDGNYLKVAVMDTGCGIKSNKKDYLFESFTQELDEQKPSSGIGIGLSICKHLVELHGGKIFATNRSTGGSKFEFSIPTSINTISLPSKKYAEDENSAAEEATSPIVETNYFKGNGAKILIADDESVNRQVLVGYLSPRGYDITLVSNGRDALKEIDSNKDFDLIILDVIMPKVSGYEVCKAIRKSNSYFELPILMLSAKTQPNDIVTGLKSGANDYIGKPVDKLEFLARVETLINIKQVHLLRQERDSAIEQADRNLQLALENAMHDPLTKLNNRESFPLKLRKAIQICENQKTALSLLLISTDRFKYINELHGHDFGDKVLKRIAQTLRECTRDSDMIFRYENDTFAIIITNLARYQPKVSGVVSGIFKKMLSNLKVPVQILNETIELSATAGASTYPFDANNFSELLSNADATLQVAKKSNRGGLLFYTPEISQQKQSKLELEAELKLALTEETLELHYQPQVSTKTNTLFGAEALIRWNHREKGMISPAEFIPVAEESDLIIPIGRWIIKQVCRDIAELNKLDISPPHIAINLSGYQFKDDLLIEHLHKQVEDNQLNPSQVELEITEGVLMDDIESTISKLQSFKEMGHKISIDDFGTGYSSLSYLKQFPIDTLKIDQSFVREVEQDSESQVIVKSIMDLAKGLKLQTIAEGVETQPQLEFLKYLECDVIQGYFFSKPLSFRDFRDFLYEAKQRRA